MMILRIWLPTAQSLTEVDVVLKS